ncbi:protein-tyrosine phosphatase-like protein, partial [Blastocladiella britannica]
LSIPIMDVPSTSLFPHIESALEFLDKAVAANARVLVHCYAGVSRSAAMVAAHLITRHGSSYRDATAKMRSVRRGVAPNRGFAYQLRV